MLKSASIFASLGPESMAKLAEMFREKEFKAGSILFKEGQSGDSFMIIQSGRVEIVKRGSQVGTGVHLADRGPGEILGEMALIENSPRFADAVAREDVTVLTLSKDQFELLLRENPTVAFEIMGALSAKLRQSDIQMISDLEGKNAQLEAANKTLKKLTEELRYSNDDLSRAKNFRDKIIENAAFFMVITDSDGGVILMNGSAERTFGISLAKMKNRSIGNMFKPIGGIDSFDEISKSLDSAGVWNGELITRRSDDSQIIVDLTAVRIDDAADESTKSPSILFMGRDITEEKNIQRQAFQLERMATRGEMAAEIAHELNNYLSIVSGNLELLCMDLEKGSFEKTEKKTDSMKNGLTRITKFVEGLMSISRPDARMEIFDLHQFLDSELFFLRPQPRFKEIEFICDWGEKIPAIEADRSQLQQVLFNLFNNASDAIFESSAGYGKITIETRYSKTDDWVVINISDNGCGMSEEDYERVFRQHFTTKKTGHGFGLLAVKRVIKTHGGRISAVPGPDGGVSFTIELPLRIPAHFKKPAMAAG